MTTDKTRGEGTRRVIGDRRDEKVRSRSYTGGDLETDVNDKQKRHLTRR